MNRQSGILFVGMLVLIMCLFIYTDILEVWYDGTSDIETTNAVPGSHAGDLDTKVSEPSSTFREGDGGESFSLDEEEEDIENTDEDWTFGQEKPTKIDITEPSIEKTTPPPKVTPVATPPVGTSDEHDITLPDDENIEPEIEEPNGEGNGEFDDGDNTTDGFPVGGDTEEDNNGDDQENTSEQVASDLPLPTHKNKTYSKPTYHPPTASLRPGGGPFPTPVYTMSDKKPAKGEKYITYLPHGQFNNQRLELENALLLAAYLKRTLIIPPAILGQKTPWKPFDILYKIINKYNKNGLEKCPVELKYSSNPPAKCDKYNDWTIIDWKEFYDLGSDDGWGKVVNFVQAEDFNIETLKKKFGFSSSDFFFFKDENPYGIKIYDDPNSVTPLGKFATRINVEDLAEWPERVLYFESLFGSERITRELPESSRLYQAIKEHFVYTHPGVLSVTKKVVSRLGNQGAFVGMHVRLGDGEFLLNFDDTISEFIEHLEEAQENNPENIHLVTTESLENDGEGIPMTGEDCLSHFDPERNTLIYMATDLPEPRDNESYQMLYDVFPCILTLSDFKDLLVELREYTNPRDQVPLVKFLIPMVDMTIASKGDPFIGTPRSTFSRYTKFLHSIYFKENLN